MMMVTSVVLFENFGASYTSFLSVVTQATPFQTVEELYTNTQYKIGDKGGTNQRINFKVKQIFIVRNMKCPAPSTRTCRTVRS